MTASRIPPAAGRALMAEFANAGALLSALDALRSEGYRHIDTFTPFDLRDVDERLGARRSRIGWVAAAGGAVGLLFSYGIQWWANVHSYPLNVGGRPAHAVPAFVLGTFEGTVLGAALAAVVGLVIVNRLPRLWAPADEIEGFERATTDRFWIEVATFASDQDRAHAADILRDAGALRTVELLAE